METPQPQVESKTEEKVVSKEPIAPAVEKKQSAPTSQRTTEKEESTHSASLSTPASPAAIAPASPSVRRLAREIGVDLSHVVGSGDRGRIQLDDVKNYARKVNTEINERSARGDGAPFEPLPDFSQWGIVERKPMNAVRRKTATHLSQAWYIPHVTQFDKADITDLEKLRKQYAKRAVEKGGKLTMTVIVLKVVASALKVFPQFNASIDMTTDEIIYKKYYNVGVAVDTDRGLLVPVIRDIDKKNIIDLSVDLTNVAERAKDRKLTLDDMKGGNFTISNLGGIGGTYFTPIVNAPEVAILGISRASIEPVYIDGEFQPRLMMPLSLSYDHRIIDGADAIRFLRWIAEALQQPFLMDLEG